MKAFLESILGSYSPVTYELADGSTVIPSGLAGVDWLYVLSGVAFLLVIYCTLRVIGGMLCKLS